MFNTKFMPLFDEDEVVSGGTAQPNAETKETEKTEPVVESIQQTTPEPTSPREIEIEYLGNKEKISLDDLEGLKTLLQKGKNSDRIQEKWETAKTTLGKAEAVARLYGYRDENGQGTVDEFLETIKQDFEKTQVNSLVEKGYSEDEAKELIELRKEKEELTKFKTEYQKGEEKKRNDLEFIKYFELVNGRPFSDSDKIPAEVLKEEKNGTPLKYAYADYIAQQSIKKVKTEKVNNDNLESSAPSMSSTVLDKTAFTETEVKTMSRDEVKKNWPAITKSMKLPSWKK